MLRVMDKFEAHRPTGTMDAHAAAFAEARAPAGGPSIDGPGHVDSADLKSVLQAIAARIDVVLDEKLAARPESDGQHRAVQAWSTVVGKRSRDVSSDLRRRALATTVLRISADGRLDLDDGRQEIADADADAANADSETEAETEAETGAETGAESQREPDQEDDAARSGAKVVDAAKPARAVVVPVSDVTTESPSPASADRSDIENRLRTVRKRLAARHARTSAARVDPVRPRASRIRRPVWRKTEIHTLVQRLLIVLAVVGASAVVSILVS